MYRRNGKRTALHPALRIALHASLHALTREGYSEPESECFTFELATRTITFGSSSGTCSVLKGGPLGEKRKVEGNLLSLEGRSPGENKSRKNRKVERNLLSLEGRTPEKKSNRGKLAQS